MRFLGIDYGTKRVGLALSDENGTLAFPFTTILNSKSLTEEIGEIIKKEKISEIVVGESLDQNNNPNKIEKELEEFIGLLTLKFFLPIHREKEFFSSFEAHSRMGKEANSARKDKFAKTEDLDSKAAAIILQRYLDRINK
jgi:putative Holliday junction resolvase